LLTFGGILLLLVVAALNYDKAYTSITFTLLAFFLFLQRLLFKNQVERNFYPAYTIALLPFLIVNGILTANPVVIYNDAENLGFRLHTIPFEDIWYGMLLILMNITFLELFRNKRNLKLQK
jgi:lycopene cyclase domain-containing protein